MAKPTITVEIAFDAGYTGTPTWTDVTDYVRHSAGISITRGRGSEGELCSPNTLTLALKNDDGRFTPGNTAGAYYPNVKKGRRIRVTATHNGTPYRRFTGYINDWRVTWPGKVSGFSDCQVTASSRLARLGNGIEFRSIIEETFLAAEPWAYYMLAEPSDAVIASDSSGHGRPALVQTWDAFGEGALPVVFGQAQGPTTDSLTAATFSGRYLIGTEPYSFGSDGTIEAFFGSTNPVDPFGNFVIVQGAYTIDMVNSGVIRADGTSLLSSGGYDDGAVHHVALVYSSGSGDLYLDGVLVDSGAIGSAITPNRLHIGGTRDLQTFDGWVAHVAFYDSALTADQVEAHAAAGLTGFRGESAGDRLERYAELAGIDLAETDFDAGDVVDLAHIETAEKTILALAREVETTDGGVLFDAPDGTLTYRDRSHRYGVTSSFTLNYAASEVTGALEPLLDDQQMVNDAAVTNVDGVSAKVLDGASRDEYGPYRTDLALATHDPDEPLVRASWIVNRLSHPTERISTLEVLLNTAGDTVTAGVLAADVGTMLTLSNLPSNAPATSMDLFAEGFSEVITADQHRVQLRTTPADLFEVVTFDDPDKGFDSGLPMAY